MVNRRRREREKEGTWSLGRKSARKSWVLNREKWSRFLVKLVGESFANKLVVRIYIKFSMFLFSFLLNFALRGEEECKSPLLHGNTIIVTSTYVWNIYFSLNVTIWSRKRFFLKIRTLYSSPFSTFSTDLYTPQSFQFKNQSHPLKRTRQQLVDLASIFQRFEN